MINQLYEQYSTMALSAWGFTDLPSYTDKYDPNEKDIVIKTNNWLNDEAAEEKTQQGLTAFVALDDAFMSIASRIYLIRNAKETIDLQYYIWTNDFVGNLILHELLKAADRGIKVRLLIDDQNGIKLDGILRSLLQHTNFEIRLFNPYKFRYLRIFDYLFRFKKVNHRMHNKLIIADGSIAVTGGRNISSEYFEASSKFQFTDMDILFYGHAVRHAQAVFADFWESTLSVNATDIIGTCAEHHLKALREHYEQLHHEDHSLTEDKLYDAQSYLKELLEHNPIQWSKAHFVADSPKKILGTATEHEMLYGQVMSIMGKPKQHLELASAYFVPTQQGTYYLKQLRVEGIKVRALTNSFAAAKGKNKSSLHAKFFDVDGKVFIGSFNYDPRSTYLNTEVGLVIESSQLQTQISVMLDQHLPQVAYQLKLNSQGQITWLDYQANGQVIEYDKDPGTSRFQRTMIKAVSYLPIEWMM
ncbi:phospholipase D family protein [Acinetobacter baumannii]|nr:phospholipase D family protein [Acinetobacter baumannii]